MDEISFESMEKYHVYFVKLKILGFSQLWNFTEIDGIIRKGKYKK